MSAIDLTEEQAAYVKAQGLTLEPIARNQPQWNPVCRPRILVYRINGRFDLLPRARAVWRRPEKHKGRWCVNDHGLVPLLAKINSVSYVTGSW